MNLNGTGIIIRLLPRLAVLNTCIKPELLHSDPLSIITVWKLAVYWWREVHNLQFDSITTIRLRAGRAAAGDFILGRYGQNWTEYRTVIHSTPRFDNWAINFGCVHVRYDLCCGTRMCAYARSGFFLTRPAEKWAGVPITIGTYKVETKSLGYLGIDRDVRSGGFLPFEPLVFW